MPLKITFGAVSEAGRKDRNEDFFGLVTPDGELLASKGIVAAIADGVGSEAGGREAAEYSVLSVLSDYYDTPETWEIPHALGKLLASTNRWLLAQRASHREFSSMASTLSLLVLRGNRYTIAHVGDTRIYMLRSGELSRLTIDHVWEGTEGSHVLKRAMGLDLQLAVDYTEGELKKGDIFLLASDGVWETLGQNRLEELLAKHPDPEEASRVLVESAFDMGSEGNLTAQVLRIEDTAEGSLKDLLLEGADLPLPPLLSQRQSIDGYEVIDLLRRSEQTLLYQVRETSSGRMLVLKTLRQGADSHAKNALLMEEWLGKRILSKHFPQIISPEKRHFLYFLTTWHEGSTLGEMLDDGHHFTVTEIIHIGTKLARALGAIHRLDIIHRDIRPENVHLGKDGKLRVLDLGSAVNPALGNEAEPFSGSPNHMAPELFSGQAASIQSDLYALGVTLYQLLTRKCPYGEIGAGKLPSFADPIPPTRFRPDIPPWLENILLKSVSRDPDRRFEMPEEFLLAMERGENSRIPAPQKTPLASRNRLLAWKITAAISILVNFFLLYVDAIETLSFSSGSPW